jgi:hypothetical protein
MSRRGREVRVPRPHGPRKDDLTGDNLVVTGDPAYSYLGCNHRACSKKADPQITDHNCCGRCEVGYDCKMFHLGSTTKLVRYV